MQPTESEEEEERRKKEFGGEWRRANSQINFAMT